MKKNKTSEKKEGASKLKKKSQEKEKIGIKEKTEELDPTITRWIQLLKALKLKQLKTSIDTEINTYEINKNVNDKLVIFLDEELKEDEMLQKIDELKNSKLESVVAIHKENMNILQEKFEKDILQMFKDYERDEEILLNNKKHLINDINKFYQNMEEEKQKRKEDIEKEDHNTMEEIYKNYIVERYIMNYNVDKFKEDDENFNNIIMENQNMLNEENEHYSTIQMEYEKNKKKLQSKEKEIHDLQLNIDSWKLKLENEMNIYEGQIEKLKNEKMLLLNHIRAIKLILQKIKHNDKQRLIDISTNLNNCIEKLEENTALANKLINFNNLCRKYEADREKHLISLPSVDKKEVWNSEEKQNMDSFSMMNDKNARIFENFFKRQNKVVLDLMILKNHLQELKKKNKKYKTEINELKMKQEVHKKVQMTKDLIINAS